MMNEIKIRLEKNYTNRRPFELRRWPISFYFFGFGWWPKGGRGRSHPLPFGLVTSILTKIRKGKEVRRTIYRIIWHMLIHKTVYCFLFLHRLLEFIFLIFGYFKRWGWDMEWKLPFAFLTNPNFSFLFHPFPLITPKIFSFFLFRVLLKLFEEEWITKKWRIALLQNTGWRNVEKCENKENNEKNVCLKLTVSKAKEIFTNF